MSCASRCGIVCTTVVSQKALQLDFYGRVREKESEREKSGRGKARERERSSQVCAVAPLLDAYMGICC